MQFIMKRWVKMIYIITFTSLFFMTFVVGIICEKKRPSFLCYNDGGQFLETAIGLWCSSLIFFGIGALFSFMWLAIQ